MTRDVNEDSSGECDYFLGIDGKNAKKLFSLGAYCKGCGEVSSAVSLDEDSEEFDDWHLLVPFIHHPIPLVIISDNCETCWTSPRSTGSVCSITYFICCTPACCLCF